MDIRYYPSKEKVEQATKEDDPLLVLVSFDGKRVLASNIDDAMEHVILLKKLGLRESEIDSYFRIIVNKDGADWTFVCPSSYKSIENKEYRIKAYYSDGISLIKKALEKIGYPDASINVPKRYRRHIDMI